MGRSALADRPFSYETQYPKTHFNRAHQPEEFGDDLSFRQGLSRVIQTKEPLTVVESGVAGFGLRCIVPLTDGDCFLGACEVGISLNKVVERALGIRIRTILLPSYISCGFDLLSALAQKESPSNYWNKGFPATIHI